MDVLHGYYRDNARVIQWSYRGVPRVSQEGSSGAIDVLLCCNRDGTEV